MPAAPHLLALAVMNLQQPAIHPYLDITSIKSANQCLSWWLVHSYLYYVIGTPVISDKDFDTLTSWLKMSWNQIDHIHKHLVSLDDLKAGSGYAIKYPLRVESCAFHVLRKIEEIKPSKPSRKPAKKLASKTKAVKIKTDRTLEEYDTLFG